MSPGAIETSRHRLLPRAMSGFMAPWSLQSRVVFMAPVATKSSVDAWGMASYLGPCQADLRGLCCCYQAHGGIQA